MVQYYMSIAWMNVSFIVWFFCFEFKDFILHSCKDFPCTTSKVFGSNQCIWLNWLFPLQWKKYYYKTLHFFQCSEKFLLVHAIIYPSKESEADCIPS